MQLLGCLADVLKENGYASEIIQGKQATQPAILRVESRRMGKVGQDVLIEMCFIPIKMPSKDEALLQFYITLFTELPQGTAHEIKKACAHCNDYCALGAFGYFDPAGQIYLKHNTIIDLACELKQVVPFAADNLSMLLVSVTRFIDALAAIGNATMTTAVAIEQELLPHM